MYDDPGSAAPSDWADGDPTQTPGHQSRDEESGEDDLDEWVGFLCVTQALITRIAGNSLPPSWNRWKE